MSLHSRGCPYFVIFLKTGTKHPVFKDLANVAAEKNLKTFTPVCCVFPQIWSLVAPFLSVVRQIEPAKIQLSS